MAYKINKIEIKNFKIFVGDPFKLKLDGKHLLLYGENGSGKSSIYWSIYTMLQSCLKKQDATEAGKYFDPANPENLRNRYSNATDESSIKMEFIDDANSRKNEYTDSKDIINTGVPGDMFMFHTLALSDFINYKFLFSIFNFRNSQDADIFEIFERDIFPTMDFSESLHDVYDADRNTSNAHDWWKYLTEEALGQLDKYQNGKFKPSGDKYKKHGEYLGHFNRLLRIQIAKIEYKTNELLASDFPLPLKINLRVEPLEFNKRISNRGKERDKKITRPRIILTAELTRAGMTDAEKMIPHPHTYLNEAKLARIALAMRFAIVNMKNEGATARGAQILCIDDMLISLDMSNRLEVIDYLLDTYSVDYQLIIMTHDRALYRIIENKIAKRKAESHWVKKELYCVDEAVSNMHYPSTELLDVKDPIIVARNYFGKHEYSPCANTLRRQCEKMLCTLLPYNMLFDTNCARKDLSGLMGQIPTFMTLYGIVDMLPNIDIYREHIMNPLSHDDLTSNMYREEMVRCINDIETLSKFSKTIIVECKDHPERFQMTISGQTVDFEVREIWDYVTDSAGAKHYKDVPVYIVASTISGHSAGDAYSIYTLYRDICNRLHLAEIARPMMETCVVHQPEGKDLVSY